MSLRARLTLGAAAAVAISIVLAALVSFVAVQRQLHDQLDSNLEDQALRLAGTARVSELFTRPQTPGPLRGETQLLQIILTDGTTVRPSDQRPLPVEKDDLALVNRHDGVRFHDAPIDDETMRVITASTGRGFAIQVARPLEGVDETLNDLRLKLAIVAAGGVGLAALLGFVVARTGLRPVTRLTAATEHVAATQDLQATIEVRERGELGRLARSFNAMLTALDSSRRQQRQLVTDASHELRTPLTSLRTNIEVLATQPEMSEAERGRLLSDLTSELIELTGLVDDVVELAREDVGPEQAFVPLHLDELVTEAVERARRHAPGLTFRITDLEPTPVLGQEQPIARALSNVLDNASKWSPEGGAIEVALTGSSVTVRDHGPGIDPVDAPHVFDRFYRAPAARSLPGSGLGLAIVRRVMELHDGTVSAEPADGGGTRVRLTFAPVPAGADPPDG